jgi:hypothetical protein
LVITTICEETSLEFFLEFFHRETENICMHVSLNTTDLQVPYPMMSSKSLLRDTGTSICVSGLI